MSIKREVLFFEKYFKRCQENRDSFIDIMKDSDCIDKDGSITDFYGAIACLNRDRIEKLINISMRGKANNE